ncbi:MAG: hypothetical protein QN178_05040 [Armatimonadota bacterium]|nr:hypothetical protein [Armatimonadota bacterium]
MRTSMTRAIAAMLVVAVLSVAPAAVVAAPNLAPAFTLELFSGKTLTLADLKGKAVILLFWAEW